MAFSGSISSTTFNALKVVDHAFRRCRLPAQAITAEMHAYALESLYLLLSELANTKTPSWCIERQIYPFYEGQPVVTLSNGTVEVLNANLRTLQELTGTTVSLPTSYTVDFNDQDGGVGTVNTVGMKWTGGRPDVSDIKRRIGLGHGRHANHHGNIWRVDLDRCDPGPPQGVFPHHQQVSHAAGARFTWARCRRKSPWAF